MLTYVICINNFVGSRLTSVNFFNIPFSIQKSRFLLLDPLLNAGVDTKLVAYWRHQYWTALSWESMEFSTFLIFAVCTSHRWLTWRLLMVSCKMQIIFYPYVQTLARVILFPIILYFYFADSQKLMHWAYNVSLSQN